MNALPPTRPAVERTDALLLRLDGFEGPLDLLLELARAQRIDLARISILALAEQFLAVIEGARLVRLELAADWLVMAAWLAWLKSRLLLPADGSPPPEALDEATSLAERLAELARIRALAAALDARPVLGRDVWARGVGEDFVAVDRSGLRLDLPGLLAAFLAASRRAGAKRSHAPRRFGFPSVADALARLERLLGADTDWVPLEAVLPSVPDAVVGAERAGLWHVAGIAGALLASLELARGGRCRLRQDAAFGPVLLRRPDP